MPSWLRISAATTIWDSSLAAPVNVPLFDAFKCKQSGRIAEYQGLISKLATYLAPITKPGIYIYWLSAIYTQIKIWYQLLSIS